MNMFPEYLIEFHDICPGMLPVPYYPGWSVSRLIQPMDQYQDSGYIFKEKVQAEIWAATRTLPDDYWEIDWSLFPSESGFIHHEAGK